VSKQLSKDQQMVPVPFVAKMKCDYACGIGKVVGDPSETIVELFTWSLKTTETTS
jgi:hypothetical protein